MQGLNKYLCICILTNDHQNNSFLSYCKICYYKCWILISASPVIYFICVVFNIVYQILLTIEIGMKLEGIINILINNII